MSTARGSATGIDSKDRSRRRRRLAALGAGLGVLTVVAEATPASAHERWFVEHPPPADWSFAASPLVLALLAAVIGVTVAWRAVAARLRSPELPVLRPLGRLVPYVPRLLGIHLGVSLLALAARGELLSPALPVSRVPAGDLTVLVEGALGVWLLTGIRLRLPALLVVAMGPALWIGAGPVALLENAALVGIAGFLVLVPPSDGTFGRVTVDPDTLRRALLVLRVGAATSLVSLAFSEKFTNPAMAREVIEAHPQLDVFALVGLHVPTDVFIAVAGSVEVLFGLLVLSGAAPQVATLVAAVPFNLTLTLFGATELLGHLPVYGVLLALLVHGSDPATARLVRALPRPARPARRRVEAAAEVPELQPAG